MDASGAQLRVLGLQILYQVSLSQIYMWRVLADPLSSASQSHTLGGGLQADPLSSVS